MRYLKYIVLFFVVLLTSCATKKVSVEQHTTKESVEADTLVSETKADDYISRTENVNVSQSVEKTVTICDSTIITVDSAGNVIAKEKHRNILRETNIDNKKDVSTADTAKHVVSNSSKAVNNKKVKETDTKKKEVVKENSCFKYITICLSLVIIILIFFKICYKRNLRKE